MKRTSLFFFIFLGLSLNAQFTEGFESLINSKALNGASVGVCVIDVTTGDEVFGYHSEQFFYPASVQKIITTASALSLLGDDFRYSTKAYFTGIIEEGILKGNVVIEATGDPSINSGYFNPNFKADLLESLKQKGIKQIDGQLLFNDHGLGHGTPQSWLYEDIGNYYGAAPQLFNYKDNLYLLTFQQKSGGETPLIIAIDPKVPYEFDLQLKCSSSVKGDHAFILGSPFTTKREIVGTISAGVGTFTIKGANAHPQFTLQEEINKQVEIIGNKYTKSKEYSLLNTTKSPKLTEIVKTTNFESINLFAEGILNTLGLEFAKEYSNAAGLQIIQDYITQKEFDLKQIIIKDGSGLSRLNAMTPKFATNWICEHYELEAFRNSLPVSGQSGTLRYLNQPGIKGAIHAKSGSAEGVVNYAGYFTNSAGKTYAFSIFVNQAHQSRYSIRREIGVFLEKCL